MTARDAERELRLLLMALCNEPIETVHRVTSRAIELRVGVAEDVKETE